MASNIIKNNTQSQLAKNTIVDHIYKIVHKLGEGSFGIVYKVLNCNTQKYEALKILKLWEIPQTAHHNLIQRFRLEFETGQIKHPNLIQTYQMGEFKGAPYFAMDYCEGRGLHERIQSQEFANIEFFESTAKSILMGLEVLHKNGKIHRDLKPENILFDEGNNPKLSDFGISGHLNIQLTQVNNNQRPNQIFGSYAYMAPEQIAPKKRTQTLLPSIDIFSFGVLCHEMLTGLYPFGPWKKEIDIASYLDNVKKGHFNLDGIKQDKWKTIIYRCLQPNPEQRYSTILDILKDLGTSRKQARPNTHTTPHALQVLYGEDHGKIYPLNHLFENKNILSCGRYSQQHKNDVALQENLTCFISKRHSTLEHIDNQIFIRDGQWSDDIKIWMSSKNGTYINGKRITQAGQKINTNDILTLGNTTLKFI